MSGAEFQTLSRCFVPPAVVLGVTLSLASGCGDRSGQPGGQAEQADDRAARSEVELGPVRVTVQVEPAEAKLSDEPELTLSIDYARGVTVRTPPFGESLGDFLIRDFRQSLPSTRGDREILEQVYTLEPMTTGQLSIYPIGVTFTDTRPGGDGKEHTIQTEGLTVQIASVLESEAPSLADLRPPAGPVELPASAGPRRWWPALVALALAAAGVAFWLRRRRRTTADQKPLSPGELAYLELQKLLEEDLAARDVKQFYVELTGVVRRYIERTTGVHAPEQTTEEFLREIGGRSLFAPPESKRLKDFLESADLVKFAALHPQREDVEESFRRAKAFLGLEQLEAAA